MARPRMKAGERKDLIVRVRVTADERAQIAQSWKQSGEPTEAAYIRGQLLGQQNGSKKIRRP